MAARSTAAARMCSFMMTRACEACAWKKIASRSRGSSRRGAVAVLRAHGPTGEARARTLRVRASAHASAGAWRPWRPHHLLRAGSPSRARPQGDTVVTYVYELTGPDEVAVKKIVHTKPAAPEPAAAPGVQRA